MDFKLTRFHADFQAALPEPQVIGAVMKCNELTASYGLALTETQAVALVETRSAVLKETGRIEYGGGVIDKIIYAFCDSPYLSPHYYEESLHELIKIFYRCKNETLDFISDDDLITAMKQAFDGVCQGSLELLSGREMEELARKLRYGSHPDDLRNADMQKEDENALFETTESN